MEYACQDCGAKKGTYHKDTCDIERCPKCKLQLLSCGCDLPKMSMDRRYLIDKDGNKFERTKVKSLDEDFGLVLGMKVKVVKDIVFRTNKFLGREGVLVGFNEDIALPLHIKLNGDNHETDFKLEELEIEGW